jgi:hypothetical protein
MSALPPDDRLQGWAVGDRVWTPMDGTGTVLQLRARSRGAPKAQVQFAWPAHRPRWIVLRKVQRMAADEPDRPSLGQQEAEVVQRVEHLEFGRGTVTALMRSFPGGLSAAIAFDRDSSVRWIDLGSGRLLAAGPPSASPGDA